MTTPIAATPLVNQVNESLLVTLYIRAMETLRPDALIQDEKAVALMSQMDYPFNTRIKKLHLNETNKLVIVLRNREFDRYTQGFLARYPKAVVVHIGCGLDTRFDRVDNGLVEWFDLDLPEIIKIRRILISDEKLHYHLLPYSVLDKAWLPEVNTYRNRHFLFLAEGVFMYLLGGQVKWLIRTLLDQFRGPELVFDAYSPVHVLVSNLQTASLGFQCRWGIWRGREIEGWGEGIRLLDQWGYMDPPEPRLHPIRWLKPVESLFRTLRIYHFQLGKSEGSD